MSRETLPVDRLTASLSRRTVVATGAKLVYAAPLVAASFHLDAIRARALDSSCTGLDPNATWTYDPDFVGPGAPDTVPGVEACCSCPPTATYYPDVDFCCPQGYTPNPGVIPTCRNGDGTQIIGIATPTCIPIPNTDPVSR